MENEALDLPRVARPDCARPLAAGTALCAIGWQGQIRGLFGFAEALRPEAARAIAGLKASGLQVAILTGDHPQRAERIGQLLGVPASGGLLPDDKVAAVRAAQGRGPVAMVGDGINDAPALAAADVGIALGCGADLSRTSADVCLLADDLARVGWVLDWSRRTVRVMRQNLFWSLVYNALGIALAASGLLNPIWAAAAMVISSVLVVGNSLRLQETEAEPGDPSPDQTSQPRLGEKKSDATAIASAA